MIRFHTLRFRMMVLFCSLVGVLLAGSYLAFWALLVREVSSQVNRQLLETARPIVADIISEPNAKDVDRMDISGEYFELLDSNGRVLQHSLNLSAPIDLKGMNPAASRPSFGIAVLENRESLHLALIPFQQPGQARVLAVAIPMVGTNRADRKFRKDCSSRFPGEPNPDRGDLCGLCRKKSDTSNRTYSARRIDGETRNQSRRVLDAFAGFFSAR